MNDDLDRRLARHFHDQLPLIDIGAPSLVSVSRRAAQRRRRLRTVAGVATTAAVGVATIAGVQTLSRSSEHHLGPAGVPASPGAPIDSVPPVGAAVAPLQMVEPQLVWNTFEPGTTEALGAAQLVTAPDSAGGGFIGFSTTPGKSDRPQPAMYRSTDGVTWTQSGSLPPGISTMAAASSGATVFAFGTSAATAAASRYDVVVGASSDGGDSWQPTTLSVGNPDLASLTGLVSVQAHPETVAAGPAGVLAVAMVNPQWADSVVSTTGGYPSGVVDDGLVVPPPCSVNYSTATTVVDLSPAPLRRPDGEPGSTTSTSMLDATASLPYGTQSPPGTPPASTVPGIRTPANSASDGTSTTVTGTATPISAAPGGCDGPPSSSADPTSTVVPWAQLGIEPPSAQLLASVFQPQMFLSADGISYTKVAFPSLPAGSRVDGVKVIGTPDGFAMLVGSADLVTNTQRYQLLTSADGVDWSSQDVHLAPLAFGDRANSFGQLADGSFAVLGFIGDNHPAVDVLHDGVDTLTDLTGVLSTDQQAMGGFWMQMGAIGSTGITAVTSQYVDPLRLGDYSIEHDGVRMNVLDGSPSFVITDVATGVELARATGGQISGAATRHDNGDVVVSNPDGTPRVTFTELDLESVGNRASAEHPDSTSTQVLHSSDGVTWSREDLGELSGTKNLNVSRIQVTPTNVLISVIETLPTQPEDPNWPTVVLVGTPKQ